MKQCLKYPFVAIFFFKIIISKQLVASNIMEELVKDKIVEWATRYAMNVTNTLMRNF